MSLAVIILAAGQGKRMNSALPKVLQPVGGRPMLDHVLETARELSTGRIGVVYGHGGEAVKDRIEGGDLSWHPQAQQLGTGHAVSQALPAIDATDTVLVLYGDVPLIRADTLKSLLARRDDEGLALLGTALDDPTGYGRILRDRDGRVTRIVEEKDANEEQRAITEINTGILAARAGDLARWLDRIDRNNAQGEYYLTDCIALAVNEGRAVDAEICPDAEEVMGINDNSQLAAAERAYQRRQAGALMRQGAQLRDPARLDIRGRVTAGRDVVIDVNVILEGDVRLGDNVRVGANTVIRDTSIAAGSEVLENCVIEQAEIGAGCRVGPFSRIRPETRLHDAAHVGNFVEIKKSVVGKDSKINHLSYIGDSAVGARVNIGAGTITCNYDGANKHKTVIGDDVFIGSDTQLIAPVKIGNGATIGAGSTITSDAPADKLTLSRSPQKSIDGWERPVKKVRSEE